MQGFRAGEFVGVDKPKHPCPGFLPLNQRKIGVRELGELWACLPIKTHLISLTSGKRQTVPMDTTYDILIQEGRSVGRSLAISPPVIKSPKTPMKIPQIICSIESASGRVH